MFCVFVCERVVCLGNTLPSKWIMVTILLSPTMICTIMQTRSYDNTTKWKEGEQTPVGNVPYGWCGKQWARVIKSIAKEHFIKNIFQSNERRQHDSILMCLLFQRCCNASRCISLLFSYRLCLVRYKRGKESWDKFVS